MIPYNIQYIYRECIHIFSRSEVSKSVVLFHSIIPALQFINFYYYYFIYFCHLNHVSSQNGIVGKCCAHGKYILAYRSTPKTNSIDTGGVIINLAFRKCYKLPR